MALGHAIKAEGWPRPLDQRTATPSAAGQRSEGRGLSLTSCNLRGMPWRAFLARLWQRSSPTCSSIHSAAWRQCSSAAHTTREEGLVRGGLTCGPRSIAPSALAGADTRIRALLWESHAGACNALGTIPSLPSNPARCHCRRLCELLLSCVSGWAKTRLTWHAWSMGHSGS